MRRKTYTVFAPMGRIIIDRPIRKAPTAPPLAKQCEPKLNRYTCAACKFEIVTGTPTFEWRQATVGAYRRLSPDGRDYVDMGGLDIYPIAAEQKVG